MNTGGISLIVLFVLAIVVGGTIAAISAMLGRTEATRERKLPYECGVDLAEGGRSRFSVKFFLIAALFIIFDVEVVFLYPWAVVFKDLATSAGSLIALGEVFIFLLILALALAYVWGKGALEWEE